MFRKFLTACACIMLVVGCSQSSEDEAAIDAAVEKALADREDAAQVSDNVGSGDPLTQASEMSDQNGDTPTGRSTEKLRDGLPTRMGSPYHMCMFTISIVGEHCGCMVNRATDVGIPAAAQVGMFGGDGKRATPAQIDQFKRIVNSCSGYNISITGSNTTAAVDKPAAPQVTANRAASYQSSRARIVQCEATSTAFQYAGSCEFHAAAGGDFMVISKDGAFFEDVYRMELDVTAPNVGQILYEYGDAEIIAIPVGRSQSDRACWESAEIIFCAR